MAEELVDLNKPYSYKYGREKKKTKKLTCRTFLCMTAPRNKTVAHTSFGNAKGRLCQERLLRSRNFATMVTCRAVKKFSSSRLIMNSRRLWNSHQRHKFLRAEASRDILKFRVSEMVFAGVFKRYFPPRTPCCLVRIQARLGTMPSKCPRLSTTLHSSNVSQIQTCLNTR